MDPLLWGEALGSKLAAYIEELRKSDSTLGLAEMAAARGGGGRMTHKGTARSEVRRPLGSCRC